MKKSKTITIKAAVLYDGKKKHKDKYLAIENGLITEISSSRRKVDFEGVVTPSIIDPHSHIGMFREGEPGSEQEGNEHLNQILPLSDPINGVYFDDRAFKEAVDFGVLYSCIIPGSGNLFGGKAKIIRNWARNRSEAQYKDYGYKMALGYNPRSTTGWKGDRPNTRMGIYGMLEKRFEETLLKRKKAEVIRERKLFELKKKKTGKTDDKKSIEKEKNFITQEYNNEFTPEDTAILEVLDAKKPVKVHVHKEDDVLYLIDLVNRYGLKVTAEHTCDVFHKEIFNALADNQIPIVYGPVGHLGYKVELQHAYYQNTKLLMQNRAEFGLMSDHPVVHVTCFKDSLKFFLIQGMSEEEAISLITYRNAKILGIDDKLGSIQKGKTASLLVWDRNPLHLAAFPRTVIAEGEVLRKS